MKNRIKFRIKSSAVIHISVISSFFAVLVIFFIAGLMLPDKDYSETENRNLASFPEFSVENVISGNFMSNFETYFSDQFINRDKIVSFKTSLSRALGITEVNDVYIGKSERLYEVPSEFNEDTVRKTTDAVNNFASRCNIENKYFILAPNSTHIIPEQLPALLNCSDQCAQINDIYSQLDSNFKCIDAEGVLAASADRDALYLRTDHHWTATAAKLVFDSFAATAELDTSEIKYSNIDLSHTFCGTLASSSGVNVTPDYLYAVVPDGIEGTFIVHNYDKQEKKTTFFDAQKLNSKNQYEVFFGGNFSRIRIYSDNINARNLLIIKDSYANCFIPMLIPHFENIIIIDPRYFSGNLEDVLLDYNFTDLLFLYNFNTFVEDTSIASVLK